MSDEPVELACCDEHGVTFTENADGRLNYCAACHHDLDVDVDREVAGPPLKDAEFRNRLTQEELEELVPVMEEYLDDSQDEVNMWLTHSKWDRDLPAGYSEQERFIPVIGYQFGAREKYILDAKNAKDTIETLKENGYGDA